MSTPIPLIELSALPEGRGRRVCKVGLDLAVFRIGDAVYAIDDSCPHAGASLSNGKLQGTRVTCPAHGLKFDLDVVCQPSAPTLEVKKYAVNVVDGIVMLAPDERSPNDSSVSAGKKTS
ncbi:Rieske 2Fe-2S domain-containing protein [Ottowia sp.]|jgi:3-phenylpropionate/trans-cinnamate dioxygenase ferredoxin subunit|uniref:Rieske (2Fe-2S) protein n=1 Tax=Ottowia sp. TaxID=1898956 RepID=UPI0025EFD190|nr:Rieske 2Fe-2S domain-containing protein [Ottowia sp.]MBK6613792.1 Rieske 2Fe-2S domain-containing protein [Ottowia sp.]MBK6748389.1 Rieske 2Fe-2S domain-containing protein [Ottowia sp.]